MTPATPELRAAAKAAAVLDVLARDLPPLTPLSKAPVASQTCATFLHIMKEFSESSCDASEVLQRVDSLAHQDAQLLQLLPLADAAKPPPTTKEEQVMDAERTSADSKQRPSLASDCDALAMDVDDGRIASPRSVDLQRSTSALCLSKAPAELMDVDEAAGDDDRDGRAAKRQRENDTEMDAHDELQRWIDLDLELDHRMDVFDFTKDHSTPVAISSSLPNQSTASPFTRHATSPFLSSSLQSSSSNSKAALQAASFLRGGASAASRDIPQKRAFLGSPWHKVTAAPFDKKSVSAALFGDDDGDDDDGESTHSETDRTTRAKPVASANSSAAARSATAECESEGESKCDDENVWGVEDDEYQEGLLSSIDHSVLCDRENRFLQWDLEMEAQQQQLNTPPPASSLGSFSPDAAASASLSSDRSKNKWLMASSPREKIAKSPSNVDIVDDWNSLDFGTFQNRTVSHILSSCLNKRKLHHPYKNQVKLVNFNMSGDAAIADPIAPTPHHGVSGSLASSLAFSGHDSELRAACGELMGGVGMSVNGAMGAFGGKEGLATEMLGKAGLIKGEKKSKKREERKRLMSLKMQETFADLEGTFTEQDLDFKNVAGAGSLSKMALAKLEALPLPDLSNLPQDLKELKRKIEATEHKVEGTKHRHRKGGPCPRCQVQNQLRAAKRAYHKRAVAHKKLPQSGSSLTMVESDATDLMFTSPPLTPTASPSFDGASPSLSPMSTASSASPALAAAKAGGAPLLPVALPASVVSAAPAKPAVSTTTFANVKAPTTTASAANLMVSVGASSQVAANNALLQQRQQSAAAQLAKNAGRSLVAGVAGASSLQGSAGAQPAAGFQTGAPRRPCGNTFTSSATSSVSSASTSPSSPETASPPVQHVTVTSA